MTSRWLAFVIWAAVAATAVFWGLRLLVSAPATPGNALAAELGAPARADLTRLFGAEAPVVAAPVVAPQVASRFKLIGVAAPKRAGDTDGLALIAIDGKPARPYRVGSPLDGGLVVLSVHARGASLGPRGGPSQVELDLPPLPAAATGVLPRLSTESSGIEESVPAPQSVPPPAEMPPPDVPPPSRPGVEPR